MSWPRRGGGWLRFALLALTGCTGAAAHSSLPITEDFSGDCTWPRGSAATDDAAFSYGCGHGSYRLTIKKLHAYHVTQDFGLRTASVTMQIDATVMSGRGTAPGTTLPGALLGVGCVRDDDGAGYVAVVGTNGTYAIARWDREFRFIAGDNRPGSIPDLSARPRIGILCDARAGSTLVALSVDGKLLTAVLDRDGYATFNQVAVYTDTYPGVVAFDRFRATVPGKARVAAARRLAAAVPA